MSNSNSFFVDHYGNSFSRSDLVSLILGAFYYTFGFKPAKNVVKIVSCENSFRCYSDGEVGYPFVCMFLLFPGDGRRIQYKVRFSGFPEIVKGWNTSFDD